MRSERDGSAGVGGRVVEVTVTDGSPNRKLL